MAAATLTREQQKEVVELYRQGESTVEIGRTYNVSHATVSHYARKAGLPLRRGRRPARPKENVLEELTQRRLALAEELKLIDEELARARVRFENHGGGQVTIHGITSMFVRQGGMARFREWLVREYGVLSAPEEQK